MSLRSFWLVLVVAGLASGSSRAATPVVDGHTHEGLTVTDGGIDTSKLAGLMARGIDVAVAVLPVDRSRTGNLEARVRDEIGQLLRASASRSWLNPAADPTTLASGVPEGRIALLYSIEWFHGTFAGDPASVRRLSDLGVRMIGLAERDADGLFGTGERAATLTPFGEQIVSAMNDAGVLIDITHLSHAQKLVVIARSRAPVVASHSLVQAATLDNFNLPEEVVAALAARGGSVWVSFNREDLLAGAPEEEAVDRLAAHIEFLVKRLGPGHVGIGTDLQKGGTYVAAPLNRGNVFAEIRLRLGALGLSPEVIDGILGGNVLRALAAARTSVQGR